MAVRQLPPWELAQLGPVSRDEAWTEQELMSRWWRERGRMQYRVWREQQIQKANEEAEGGE